MTMRRKIFGTLALMVCIGIVALAAQPWKQRAAAQIKAAIEAQGFRDVQVEVTSLSPSHIRLSRLTIAKLMQAEEVEVEIHSLTTSGAKGQWRARNFRLSALPEDMPALAVQGDYTASQSQFETSIRAVDDKNDASLKAQLLWDQAQQERSALVIEEGMFKSGGGQWRLEPATLKLAQGEVWTLKLNVAQQPLAQLLAAFGQAPLSATGEVEGVIPVRIDLKKGEISFDDANLHSRSGGVMKLAPETLPAQGTEVGLLRDLMADFHFETLQVSVGGMASLAPKTDSKNTDTLAIQLRLEGKNPAVYDGKPVHLNINLTGDLVSLMQQSLLPMLNPAQWMHEEANEQNKP